MATAIPRSAPQVVVVDDDEDCRGVLAAIVETRGFSVQTFGGGWEALDHVRDAPPVIMLVDLRMPDLDGESLARAVRGDPRCAGVALVAVTGRVADGSVADAFDAYVQKPVEPDLLMDVVRVLADR